jgi:hypothetical protein
MLNLELLLTGSFLFGLTFAALARAVALRLGYWPSPPVIHRRFHLDFHIQVRSDRFWVGFTLQRLCTGSHLIFNPIPCLSLVWSW